MDQKTFKRVSKEIFLEYGFELLGKTYVLVLEDITLAVNYRTCRGIRSFDYYYFINALHDETEPFERKYDSAAEIHMEHDPSRKGYHSYHLAFEEYAEGDYRQLLTSMLHAYFDPYKENALQYLKENALRFGLREQGQKYLGVYDEIEKSVAELRKKQEQEEKARAGRIRSEAHPEEHFPVVKICGNIVTVTVGASSHPMEESHRISAIGLQTDKECHSVRLAIGEEPVASFTLENCETPVQAMAYCTVHGMWKSNISYD